MQKTPEYKRNASFREAQKEKLKEVIKAASKVYDENQVIAAGTLIANFIDPTTFVQTAGVGVDLAYLLATRARVSGRTYVSSNGRTWAECAIEGGLGFVGVGASVSGSIGEWVEKRNIDGWIHSHSAREYTHVAAAIAFGESAPRNNIPERGRINSNFNSRNHRNYYPVDEREFGLGLIIIGNPGVSKAASVRVPFTAGDDLESLSDLLTRLTLVKPADRALCISQSTSDRPVKIDMREYFPIDSFPKLQGLQPSGEAQPGK